MPRLERRTDQLQFWKVSPVAPRITGQERHARDSGMRADEKIGQDAGLDAAAAPVGNERFSREEQGLARNPKNLETSSLDHGIQRFDGRQGDRKFGIDHVVDRQRPAYRRGVDLRLRPVAPDRVIPEDVENDVGVDEDQSVLASREGHDLVRRHR